MLFSLHSLWRRSLFYEIVRSSRLCRSWIARSAERSGSWDRLGFYGSCRWNCTFPSTFANIDGFLPISSRFFQFFTDLFDLFLIRILPVFFSRFQDSDGSFPQLDDSAAPGLRSGHGAGIFYVVFPAACFAAEIKKYVRPWKMIMRGSGGRFFVCQRVFSCRRCDVDRRRWTHGSQKLWHPSAASVVHSPRILHPPNWFSRSTVWSSPFFSDHLSLLWLEMTFSLIIPFHLSSFL